MKKIQNTNNEIVDSLLAGVKYLIKEEVKKTPNDRTFKNVRILSIDGNNSYHILLNGKEYHNIRATSTAPLAVNALVDVKFPQNNENLMEILNYKGDIIPPFEGVVSVNGKSGIVTLNATDVGALPSTTVIPTKVSELNNDLKFQTENQVTNSINAHNTNVSAHTDIQNKISTETTNRINADTNLQTQITNNDTDISNLQTLKADKTEIPTKVSQLQNDSGYLNSIPLEYVTDTEMQNYAQPKGDYATNATVVNGLATKLNLSGGTMTGNINMGSNYINNIPNATQNQQPVTFKQLNDVIAGLGTVFDLKGTKATTADLPTTGNKIGDVWYVESESVGYIWLQDISGVLRWEKFGQQIDLSGYLTKADLLQTSGQVTNNAMSQKAVTDNLNLKVDKISGKQLSTNDFTDVNLTKLNGIENNANNYVLPTASATVVGGIKVGTNLNISNSVLSATDTTYNIATPSANGLMSSTDKAKLNGIQNGAEVNVNSDWNAISGDAQILNKPTLAVVATSGSYADLSNKPIIPINSDFTLSGLSDTNITTPVANETLQYNGTKWINAVAKQTPQLQSNWNEASTSSVQFIQNKPTSLPPSGIAGGELSGNYPDPTISIKSDLNVPKVLQNGRTFSNVASIGTYDSTNEFVIKTKIPFISGNNMTTTHITGYAYVQETSLDISISFYPYKNTFSSISCISKGGWQPSIKLSTYIENGNKYVAISLIGETYFTRFVVDFIDIWHSPRDYSKNWEVLYKLISTAGTIVPQDDIVNVPYRAIATDISGNASTATNATNATNADGSNYTRTVRESDTRRDNQPPQWYMSTYGRTIVCEFKDNSKIGLKAIFPEVPYAGQMSTYTSYGDPSGGRPVQLITCDTGLYFRTSASNTAWNTWQKIWTGTNNGGNADTVGGKSVADFVLQTEKINKFATNFTDLEWSANGTITIPFSVHKINSSIYTYVIEVLVDGKYRRDTQSAININLEYDVNKNIILSSPTKIVGRVMIIG